MFSVNVCTIFGCAEVSMWTGLGNDDVQNALWISKRPAFFVGLVYHCVLLLLFLGKVVVCCIVDGHNLHEFIGGMFVYSGKVMVCIK